MVRGILVRHGETEHNVRGSVNGDPAAPGPLSQAGEEQARGLGLQIASEPIDLCVTSEFERARRTAELALAGRDVPHEVWPELNDPRFGSFEGGALDEYRAWAAANGSGDAPPGGGESRQAIVARYARALRRLLDRDEDTVLVVAHSLPVAYVLAAVSGVDPAPRAELALHAHPYVLPAEELRTALDRLESWCAAPTW